MGLNYHKRVKIDKDTYANISKSGVSISKKVGNVTLNSKRGATVNLGNGVVWKPGKKNNAINPENNFMQMLLMQQMMNGVSDTPKQEKQKKKKDNKKKKSNKKKN